MRQCLVMLYIMIKTKLMNIERWLKDKETSRLMNMRSLKGVQIDLKAFGADAKANKTYKAKVQESLLYNCDEFEKMLTGRDDFFDFTQSENYDLITMRRGTIIKFDGYIKVPEEFDYTQTIDRFKPLLVASIVNDSMDKSEQDAIKSFLKQRIQKFLY